MILCLCKRLGSILKGCIAAKHITCLSLSSPSLAHLKRRDEKIHNRNLSPDRGIIKRALPI